jgi:hypothetical protein
MGGIFLLLTMNKPKLDTERPVAATSTKSTPDQPSAAGTVGGDSVDVSQADQTTEKAKAASPESEEGSPDPEDPKTAAVSTVEEAQPVARPPKVSRPTTKNSPCPKFITDEEGIQRINRKCWK